MLIILFYARNKDFFKFKIAINYLSSPIFVLFIYLYKKIFFFFFVFLVYNDVYFEHTERYKKDNNQITQNTLYSKTITDELDFLKKTVVIQ